MRSARVTGSEYAPGESGRVAFAPLLGLNVFFDRVDVLTAPGPGGFVAGLAFNGTAHGVLLRLRGHRAQFIVQHRWTHRRGRIGAVVSARSHSAPEHPAEEARLLRRSDLGLSVLAVAPVARRYRAFDVVHVLAASGPRRLLADLALHWSTHGGNPFAGIELYPWGYTCTQQMEQQCEHSEQ